MIHYNSPRIQLEDEDLPMEDEITIPSHRSNLAQKQQRVECIKCHKPAVLYRAGREGKVQIVYEHRDEPPIAEFIYKGSKMYRYRRCSGGFSQNGLEVIGNAGLEEEQEVYDDDYNDPPASDLISDIPDPEPEPEPELESKNKQKSRPHSPSMREIGSKLNTIRDEQRKMYKDIHAIKSVLEMWIRGDLVLTHKPNNG